MRAAAALYRLLARLLPGAFRREFGAAMEESFITRAGRRSGGARLFFIVAALVDLVRTVTTERSPLARRSTVSELAPSAHLGDRVRQDLKLAVRALRGRAAFSCAVIVMLALGVGANAAVFGLVDAVLFRPLPVADPARLVGLFTIRAGAAESPGYGLDDGLSYSSFSRVQQQSRLMTGVAGFIDVKVGVDAASRTRQLTAGAVSGNYFELLGVRPAAGRMLVPSDDRLGAPEHVTVLSHDLWSLAFGRDPRVVGQTIRIGGTPFVIAGVAAPGFRGTNLSSQPELWVPMTTVTEIHAGGIWNGPLGRRMFGDHPLHWVGTIGRLAAGASSNAAADDVNRILPPPTAVPGADRNRAPVRVVARPLTESATIADRASLVRFLAVLGTVVALTLVIACMNVANLIWAWTAERAREIAVRSALGAGRSRLLWQLLLEYLLLAAGGAAAALFLFVVTVRVLSTFALPGSIPIGTLHIGMSGSVAALAALLSGASMLLIGLAPALAASRGGSAALLRSHGVGARSRPRGLLVVGQVAMTLVLLVGASLFLRSLREGLRTDLGFTPKTLASVSVDLSRYGYSARTAKPYYDEVLRRVGAMPGGEGVALATHLPLATVDTLPFDAPGGPFTVDKPLSAGVGSVSAEYFRLMGMPVLQGRAFDTTDSAQSASVAVVNETAARRLFENRPAIGGEIRLFGAKSSTVVGVVRDAKYTSVLESGVPMVYLNLWQDLPTGGVSVVIKTPRPKTMAASLRDVVQNVDPHVALYDARAVSEQVDAALAPQRFGSVLLGLFAAIGLTVAAVGIYSAVGRMVAQRMSELGIRVALGASRAEVLRAVLGRTSADVSVGLLIGLALAVPMTRALGRFLVGVSPLDSWSFASAAVLFIVAATAAIVAPARRAMNADPLLTLRAE